MPDLSRIFNSSLVIFSLALLVRAILLAWGGYQDSHSAVKYTDIDYYVFTDAARAVHHGRSPYTRATYRYTPLLAWILIPTSWSGKDGLWFQFGKVLFAVSDLIVGWLICSLLQEQGMNKRRALQYASVWLLNPMVANISTRGSSEALLCALVIATLYAFEKRQLVVAGILLGLSVHFKIYPFVYGVSMFWALKSTSTPSSNFADLDFSDPALTVAKLFNKSRITLIVSALLSFTLLNALMYHVYGQPFLEHTFFYHLTRTDHRHNYSVYNILLYLASVKPDLINGLRPERLAFIPQLLLSTVLLPLLPITHISLPTTMLAQTLAFVTFNKVCTAQYFLWYLVFLPLYLPQSSLTQSAKKGVLVLGAWIAGQGVWLACGFKLEFLGQSFFVGGLRGLGLWEATIGFFVVNCWILSIIIRDGASLVRQHLVRPDALPAAPFSSTSQHQKGP